MNEDAPLNHISAPKRVRMTRAQRREQLIGIARGLFGAKGYDAVSIEEIASAADEGAEAEWELLADHEHALRRSVFCDEAGAKDLVHSVDRCHGDGLDDLLCKVWSSPACCGLRRARG